MSQYFSSDATGLQSKIELGSAKLRAQWPQNVTMAMKCNYRSIFAERFHPTLHQAQ